MLTEDEELKLQSIIEEIGTEGWPDISQVKWVITKLKETNDEFKAYRSQVDALVVKEWEAHWKRNEAEDVE